jgi:membrane protein DedA with SNARE-associated domain
MEETAPEKSGKTGVFTWLKKHIAALSGLLIALAVMAAIFGVYLNNPDIFSKLQGYGYTGAFVISVILNGTLILPVSNMAVMMAVGATLPLPWLVGLAGGVGAAIGEMTGYMAGRGGRGLLAKNKMYNRVEGWVKKWGWIAVFVMSIVPLAFDVVGIIAGALRMPVWRFFLACMFGRILSYIFMIYMASWGLQFLPWLD